MKYIKIKEAVELSGLSKATIHNKIKKGLLDHTKDDKGTLLVQEDQVEALAQSIKSRSKKQDTTAAKAETKEHLGCNKKAPRERPTSTKSLKKISNRNRARMKRSAFYAAKGLLMGVNFKKESDYDKFLNWLVKRKERMVFAEN